MAGNNLRVDNGEKMDCNNFPFLSLFLSRVVQFRWKVKVKWGKWKWGELIKSGRRTCFVCMLVCCIHLYIHFWVPISLTLANWEAKESCLITRQSLGKKPNLAETVMRRSRESKSGLERVYVHMSCWWWWRKSVWQRSEWRTGIPLSFLIYFCFAGSFPLVKHGAVVDGTESESIQYVMVATYDESRNHTPTHQHIHTDAYAEPAINK